ncbi:MAG: hypothetical protein HQL11_00485 [Candidatus Omnitrophica bacterium]|nr:hypothetical protein [Candidatus Omnitrophota bacterium]
MMLWESKTLWQAYAAGALFLAGMVYGALFLLFLHRLTGGRWGQRIRPALLTMATQTSWAALVFLPVTGKAGILYSHADPVFFPARAAFYWIVWVMLASPFGSERSGARVALPTKAAAAGLCVLVFTGTFAAFDWALSLYPHAHSTVFGLLWIVSQALLSLSLAIGLSLGCGGCCRGREAEPSGRSVSGDLANLLLTFVLLWAYLAYSQGLIIWAANLPEEASWFAGLFRGGWQHIGAGVAVAGLAMPLGLLAVGAIRRREALVGAVAVWIAVSRFADWIWWTGPAWSPEVPGFWDLRWMLPLVMAAGWVWILVGRCPRD